MEFVSVPHVLLGLLEEQPRHGYDLKREYDRRFATDRPVAVGQVYSTLGRLHRDRRVSVAGVEVADGPERTAYAITDDGVAELERWLREPEAPAPYLQSVLYGKVVLSLLSGRSAAEVLDRQRSAHLAVMRQLTARKHGSDLPTALAADFALFHLDADLRWIELTGARLERLSKELS